MSNVPYLLPNARWGQKMNDEKMIDYMIYDGLWDIFNDYHMRITAENVIEKWNITWEEQDEFALESQQRTEKAQKEDKFKGSNVRLN